FTGDVLHWPVPGSQLSLVQALPSLHRGACTQVPLLHVSIVQMFPSSHCWFCVQPCVKFRHHELRFPVSPPRSSTTNRAHGPSACVPPNTDANVSAPAVAALA